ncbi:unnamed protein product [Cuscuta campestris]|uniref:Uncharacterized protein n=1 Tax=Cuscuta campestris TaxID=132261 RepID=A0A484LCH7_9ASTE|nr:unnamed protein product [Cuscuta campestris]
MRSCIGRGKCVPTSTNRESGNESERPTLRDLVNTTKRRCDKFVKGMRSKLQKHMTTASRQKFGLMYEQDKEVVKTKKGLKPDTEQKPVKTSTQAVSTIVIIYSTGTKTTGTCAPLSSLIFSLIMFDSFISFEPFINRGMTNNKMVLEAAREIYYLMLHLN